MTRTSRVMLHLDALNSALSYYEEELHKLKYQEMYAGSEESLEEIFLRKKEIYHAQTNIKRAILSMR